MHRSTRFLVFSLVAAFCTLPAQSIRAADDLSVRQQIEEAERAAGKAIAKRDFTAIEKYWSPSMLVNSPGNSILTREQVFAAIRENKLNYSGYTNDIEAFNTYGDIAVMMGHETLIPDTGPEAGKKLYRRYTDVWQRSNGAWMQIARQATYTDDTAVHYTNKQRQ